MIAGDSGFICNACVVACSALLQPSASQAPSEERPDRYAFQRLARHFAPIRPQELLATSRSYALRQQADLQAALDELFGERVVPQNFVGIRAQYRHEVTDFAEPVE